MNNLLLVNTTRISHSFFLISLSLPLAFCSLFAKILLKYGKNSVNYVYFWCSRPKAGGSHWSHHQYVQFLCELILTILRSLDEHVLNNLTCEYSLCKLIYAHCLNSFIIVAIAVTVIVTAWCLVFFFSLCESAYWLYIYVSTFVVMNLVFVDATVAQWFSILLFFHLFVYLLLI